MRKKKTRRDFIKTIGIAAAGSSILSASHFKCSKGEKHPNVILIISDDQGYGDIGVHGNKIIETPVLDKLALESVTFNRFYVSSVCAPTRASLLTGRYYTRFIKIGAKVVRNSRYVTFQMAEVTVNKKIFTEILYRIDKLRFRTV